MASHYWSSFLITLMSHGSLKGPYRSQPSPNVVYIQAPPDEEDQVAVLLKALPPEFKNIITIIKEKEPAPKLEDAIASVQEEEKKLKGNHSSTPNYSGAYVTTSSSKKCYGCGKPGHVAQDCYSKHPCPHCGKTNHPPSKCYYKDRPRTQDNGKGKAKVNLVKDKDKDKENIHYVASCDDSSSDSEIL